MQNVVQSGNIDSHGTHLGRSIHLVATDTAPGEDAFLHYVAVLLFALSSCALNELVHIVLNVLDGEARRFKLLETAGSRDRLRRLYGEREVARVIGSETQRLSIERDRVIVGCDRDELKVVAVGD